MGNRVGTSVSLLLPNLGSRQKEKKEAWCPIFTSSVSLWCKELHRVVGRCFYFSLRLHLPGCGLAPHHCLDPLHALKQQARWILQEIISSEATLTPQTHCLLLVVHPRRGFVGTAETGRLMVCGTPLCQIPGETSSYFEFPLFI